MASARDVESPPLSYAPLPSGEGDDRLTSGDSRSRKRLLCAALAPAVLFAVAATVVILSSGTGPDLDPRPAVPDPVLVMDRGVAEGVSSKSSGAGTGLLGSLGPYPWTNKMLSWQRTGFHFQPEKNWMNGR